MVQKLSGRFRNCPDGLKTVWTFFKLSRQFLYRKDNSKSIQIVLICRERGLQIFFICRETRFLAFLYLVRNVSARFVGKKNLHKQPLSGKFQVFGPLPDDCGNCDKYILKLGQILQIIQVTIFQRCNNPLCSRQTRRHLAIWTNKCCNFDKYVLQF